MSNDVMNGLTVADMFENSRLKSAVSRYNCARAATMEMKVF